MIGLCARFGWLPSAAAAEDWSALSQLAARLMEESEQTRVDAWRAGVRQGWK